MKKEYGKCKNFDSIYCPEKNKEIMKELISKTTLLPNIRVDLTEGVMIGEKVNETICSTCTFFE